MSTLKERLHDYSQQPDGHVWDSISSTMRRRLFLRRGAAVAISSAIVAAAVVMAVRSNNTVAPVVAEEGQTVSSVASGIAPTDVVVAEATTTMPTANTQNILTTETVSATDSPQQETTNPVTAVAEVQTVAASQQQENKTVVSPAATPVTAPAPRQVADKNNFKSDNKTDVVTPVQEPAVSDNNSVASSHVNVAKNKILPVDSLRLMIPNAFAPSDANPENHIFRVVPSDPSTIRSFKIFIYSRSGQLVYHSEDINAGWDGTYRGKPQPMGAYVYILEVLDISLGTSPQHSRGTVMLIR